MGDVEALAFAAREGGWTPGHPVAGWLWFRRRGQYVRAQLDEEGRVMTLEDEGPFQVSGQGALAFLVRVLRREST